MPAALVVKDGPLAGQRFEVPAEVMLGRENAGVLIDDPRISRSHARIRPAGGGLEVEDLGSKHGTWVNGKQIMATTPLASGDELMVGGTTLVVELPRAAATAATPVISVPPAAAATAVTPVPPAPTPPAPPPPAATPPPPAAPLSPGAGAAVPAEAFGTYAAPATRRSSRRVASRTLTPTLLAFGIIVGDAVLLVWYFAQH